jgi:hypothetical protein
MQISQTDPISLLIAANAKAATEEILLQCRNALKHLRIGDSDGALQALTGLEDRMRYAQTMLDVLRQWHGAQLQQPQPHGGTYDS